ncbi:hypothetical protein BC829DRAFT_386226 [Chytridium lagenaria]|nr:hypothetical protein BC829DRAFT_386226 [Chytridium lagenaria]
MWDYLEVAAKQHNWCTPFLFKLTEDAMRTGSWNLPVSIKQIVLQRRKAMPGLDPWGYQNVYHCSSTSCNVKSDSMAIMKTCSRCRKTIYCSSDCQIKHWKQGHKSVCKVEVPTPASPPRPTVKSSSSSKGVELIECRRKEKGGDDARDIDPNVLSAKEVNERYQAEMGRRCVEAKARFRGGADYLSHGTQTLLDRSKQLEEEGQYGRSAQSLTLMIDSYEMKFFQIGSALDKIFYAELLLKRGLSAMKAAENGQNVQAVGLIETVRKDCNFLLHQGAFRLPMELKASLEDLERRAKEFQSNFKLQGISVKAEDGAENAEAKNIDGAADEIVDVTAGAAGQSSFLFEAAADEIEAQEIEAVVAASDRPKRRGRRWRQYRIRYRNPENRGGKAQVDPYQDALDSVSIVNCKSLLGSFDGICPCCRTEWTDFVDPTLAVLLPCAHPICITCLLRMRIETQKPLETEFHGLVKLDFKCTNCRHEIPPTIIDVIAENISRAKLVESIYLIGSRLPLDEDARAVLISSLLVKHEFDIAMVESALFNTIGLMDKRDLNVPLTTEQKQRIYSEARAPVEALRQEYIRLKKKVDDDRESLHVDEKEQRETFKMLQKVRRQLYDAEQNASNEIFARMNEAGLMGAVDDGRDLHIDLHGLQINEAKDKVREYLVPILPVLRKAYVITGRGAHSKSGKSVLKAAMLEFLPACLFDVAEAKDLRVVCEPVPGNKGLLLMKVLPK